MKPHPHRVTLSPRALIGLAKVAYERMGYTVDYALPRDDGSIILDIKLNEPATTEEAPS